MTLILSACLLAMDGQCDLLRIGPGGRVCTAIAVASVVLNVTDAGGDPVPSATITFQVDGGMPVTGTCDGNCGQVVLAFEQVGQFDITIEAVGFLPTTRRVNVELDDAGCHPVTRNVTVTLAADTSVAVLAGVWETNNFFGRAMLRFGEDGEIVGAILFDRTIAGDGNFYIAYNGRSIRGAPGQSIFADNAPEPIRNANIFTWETMTLGSPVGFSNAEMSSDFQSLTGTLQNTPATYNRVSPADVPTALLDPL